jgi:hypothetical protein
MAVSQCLSGESIALHKLSCGEAPPDGEFFSLSRKQANGKAQSEGLVLWSRCGHASSGPRAALDANKPAERHLVGSG